MSTHKLPLYRGRRERLESDRERGKLWKEFLLIYYEGADTVLGADAHRGAFSERTSRILAGLDPELRPHTLLQWLPTGIEPPEESARSIVTMWRNLMSRGVMKPPGEQPDLPEEPKRGDEQ